LWHLSRFQPSEIIDLAVQIEEKGAEFYQKLAEKAESKKTKDLLLFLASEEKKHLLDFKKLGDDFEAVSPRESYPGEYFDYLKSTVETHMFNDLERLGQLIEATKSESDIVRLAVSFEKDSILFFMSFRKLVGEDKGTVIDDLIKEEEEHLIKLSQIKKELQKGEM